MARQDAVTVLHSAPLCFPTKSLNAMSFLVKEMVFCALLLFELSTAQFPICHICAGNLANPNAVVPIPGLPQEISCLMFHQGGQIGLIPPGYCELATNSLELGKLCGCTGGNLSGQEAMAPTEAPSKAPTTVASTPKPSITPTFKPTNIPTSAPPSVVPSAMRSSKPTDTFSSASPMVHWSLIPIVVSPAIPPPQLTNPTQVQPYSKKTLQKSKYTASKSTTKPTTTIGSKKGKMKVMSNKKRTMNDASPMNLRTKRPKTPKTSKYTRPTRIEPAKEEDRSKIAKRRSKSRTKKYMRNKDHRPPKLVKT